MREKLLIVGAGAFGRLTLEQAIEKYDCAFIDDNRLIGEEINRIKVVGAIKDLTSLFGEYTKIVISIGNNSIREKIYNEAKIVGYNFPNIISSTAYISPRAYIGEGCVMLDYVVIQKNVRVGNATIIKPEVKICHDSIVGSFCSVYTKSEIRSYAQISNGIKLGSKVIVKNKSIVIKDIGDKEIV